MENQDHAAYLDLSTRSFVGSESTAAPEKRGLALTLMTHPFVKRIGETFNWLHPEQRLSLSRTEPAFGEPGSSAGTPLALPSISRTPFTMEMLASGQVQVLRGACKSKIEIDGQLLEREMVLAPERVQQGLPLVLSGQAVLWLHPGAPPGLQSLPSMDMVGAGAALGFLRQEIQRLAAMDMPVLIRGETGVGKELTARALHAHSARARRPFVAVNMAALPPHLAPSELFGVRKGAFTGADRDRPGFFQEAHGGTLFLDEIGEASTEVQTALLRVLETGQVQAVGAPRGISVDVRVLAATDAGLETLIAEGRFREPLLHRLNGYEMHLPPLRERREDMGLLFRAFARQTLKEMGICHLPAAGSPFDAPWLRAPTVLHMLRFHWPGNIRQFRNVIRKLIITDQGAGLVLSDASDLRSFADSEPGAEAEARQTPVRRKPARVTAEELTRAMEASSWDPKSAAEQLGISRTSIYDLIKKTPGLRTAADLSREEITACHNALNGDPEAMAMQLKVSCPALKRRLKAMGW